MCRAARAGGLLAGCAALVGCGSDAVEIRQTGDGELGPAVMVANLVRSPEEANLYVGAFASLPNEELDRSAMLEVGAASSANAFDGSIFVWDGEASRYTRYSVDAALQLVPGPVVSFANFGVTGPVITGFVSSTRAFTMLSDGLGMVVWDPSSMQVVGTVSTDALVDPAYPRIEYGEPALFGEYLAWPILWSDYDNLRFKPELGVALVNVETGEPARVIRDSRCGAGWSLYTDASGDLYVTGNAYFGFAQFFGEGAPTFPDDCVLRVKANTSEFDPTFLANLNQATGSPAVYHAWHVGGGSLLAAVWDPADDATALPSPDDYWNAPLLRKLVRLEAGSSTLVAEIPKSSVWSTSNYVLDGELYVLASDGSFAADGTPNRGRSTLYRVHDSGVERAFSSSGEVWSIGRVR